MLAKIFFWIAAGFAIAFFTTLVYAKNRQKAVKNYKDKLANTEKLNEGLVRTIELLRKGEAIKEEEKKEADEKKDAIDSGKLSPDDVLPK